MEGLQPTETSVPFPFGSFYIQLFQLVRMSVKSEVLKTLSVKTTGYWYVTPCRFFDCTELSGEPAALII